MGTVRPLKLSDASFLKRLRAIIARESQRVILTLHAKRRMAQRKINMRQVLECLRKGRISEPAHLTIQGDWKATLEHLYAGDLVKVAVAIEQQEDGDWAIVITVMD